MSFHMRTNSTRSGLPLKCCSPDTRLRPSFPAQKHRRERVSIACYDTPARVMNTPHFGAKIKTSFKSANQRVSVRKILAQYRRV
jgi:hypothetical protein